MKIILTKIKNILKSIFLKEKIAAPVSTSNSVLLGRIPEVSIINRTHQPYHTKVVAPVKSIPTINYFFSTNPNITYKFVLRRLSNAIKNDWPLVELCIAGPVIVKIDKHNFENVLMDAERYYISRNDIENIKKCRKLLAKHKVNLIIDSTKIG